ncbi:MAG: hypothetical protein AB7F40_08190 [Victivallaceae bacterium]|nr:hypothetical protein [Victivallaceae bacterium]
MARYEESVPNTLTVVLFLAALFLLVFQPWQIGMKELYWQEGLNAAEALELNLPSLAIRAHGELLGSGYPLYPAAVRLLYWLGVPMEFALRLLSVLPCFGVALWVFLLGRSAAGLGCGAVAAAAWITGNIVMEKTLDGYPEMAMIFFVTGGQFIWFTLWQHYNRPNLAWMAAAAFAVLAFLTAGFPALLYFAFPFIFMRRPLSVPQKLRKPGAAAGAVLIVLAVTAYLAPYFAETSIRGRLAFIDTDFGGYHSHLWTFPFDAVWRLLPWSLAAWPVFCASYRPLDPAPVFSRFLRTLVISTFFLLWFSPFTDVRDIALLMPALSILIGINYNLLMRRHGKFYRRLLQGLPYVAVVLGVGTAAFFLTGNEVIEPVFNYFGVGREMLVFRNSPMCMTVGVVYGGLIAGIGVFLLWRGARTPLWIEVSLVMLAAMLFFWAVSRPYSAQKQPKRRLAEALHTALKDRDVERLYKLNIAGLYGECFYLGLPVTSITDLSAISPTEPEVYLLSTGFPQLPERAWVKLADTKLVDASADEKSLQIYCGTLIPEPEAAP